VSDALARAAGLPAGRRRWPVVATMLVGFAVAAMIALGVWQYMRAGEKEALIALYERNIAMSSEVKFPVFGPVPDDALFRYSGVFCMDVVGWRSEGGRAANGKTAYRHIAECRTGAEGPGALVQAGTSEEPNQKPRWNGGTIVRGWLVTEPDHRNLIQRLFGASPPLRPMLVLAEPVAGLGGSARPDPAELPNNHIAYMWQWFFFAGIAALIFWLALRQRREV